MPAASAAISGRLMRPSEMHSARGRSLPARVIDDDFKDVDKSVRDFFLVDGPESPWSRKVNLEPANDGLNMLEVAVGYKKGTVSNPVTATIAPYNRITKIKCHGLNASLPKGGVIVIQQYSIFEKKMKQLSHAQSIPLQSIRRVAKLISEVFLLIVMLETGIPAMRAAMKQGVGIDLKAIAKKSVFQHKTKYEPITSLADVLKLLRTIAGMMYFWF